MPISYEVGDILNLKPSCPILVNPVNCLGISGKGLALQFKNLYPTPQKMYEQFCEEGRMKIGRLFVAAGENITIIFLPTKVSWTQKSSLTIIETGLETLRGWIFSGPPVKELALPALGCGLGGLGWNAVNPLIEKYLTLDKIHVRVILTSKRFH